MPQHDKIHYQLGFPDEQRHAAAALYDLAFGQKFALAIRSKTDRLKLFAAAFNPQFALAAFANDRLVGLAGVQTTAGSLTEGITASSLIDALGWFRALRAMAVFSLYEREAQSGELVMDGITVDPEYRGYGIGTHLLEDVLRYGREHDYESVRLDVIDTNPAAQRLYERFGFEAVSTERFAFLKPMLGFGASTRMAYDLNRVRSTSPME